MVTTLGKPVILTGRVSECGGIVPRRAEQLKGLEEGQITLSVHRFGFVVLISHLALRAVERQDHNTQKGNPGFLS